MLFLWHFYVCSPEMNKYIFTHWRHLRILENLFFHLNVGLSLSNLLEKRVIQKFFFSVFCSHIFLGVSYISLHRNDLKVCEQGNCLKYNLLDYLSKSRESESLSCGHYFQCVFKSCVYKHKIMNLLYKIIK